MHSVIRIGSRESALAVRQAVIIRDLILESEPEAEIEIITMKTTGDKILDKSLEKIGGKGLFVKELDRALMEGRIDLAVHSLKDMPMEENEELPILAYGKREDPRDVLIYRKGLTELPEHAVIGTSSRRRALQMEQLCPGCSFRGIRGNVQTRMRKLEEEGYDASSGTISLCGRDDPGGRAGHPCRAGKKRHGLGLDPQGGRPGEPGGGACRAAVYPRPGRRMHIPVGSSRGGERK